MELTSIGPDAEPLMFTNHGNRDNINKDEASQIHIEERRKTPSSLQPSLPVGDGLSTLLHWLISQSFFLVGIEAYSAILERYPQYDITTCGYSPVGIVSSISVVLIMLCCLIGLSRRRFKTGMRVAGSRSLAIAAACHPDPNPMEDGESLEAQTDAEYLPLQWGVIQVEGEIGHCAFSSQEVVMPEDGRVYE